MTDKEVLLKAANLFSKKYSHCKYFYARSKTNRIVEVYSKAAVSFCLSGIILKLSKEYTQRVSVLTKLGKVINKKYKTKLVPFNDRPKTTKKDIINILKETAKTIK